MLTKRCTRINFPLRSKFPGERGVMHAGAKMQKPDIALIYEDSLPSEIFEEFRTSFDNEELNILVDSRPPSGPQACIEWFIPTLVMIFIAKSYFGGFFNELGKAHGLALNAKLSGLATKIMSTPRIEPILSGSSGKLSTGNPYSLAFSIFAEANDGKKFKLLIPKPSEENNYNEIINIFLEFLSEYHSGIKNLEDTGFDSCAKLTSGTIFVQVNQKTKCVEWLDQRNYH